MAPKQQTVTESTITAAEHKIEGFAEDLGKLLGNAKTKAEGWMAERTSIAEYLTGIRDTANGLLAQLGISTPERPQPARGRRRTKAGAFATDASAVPSNVASAPARKPRTM